jgi:NAD(P)-dependent dehydrogenase (short-subunit alcohol dehydrogenase family)
VSRVILITGASRGIGAATARMAAQRGYAVCVNYRDNRDAAASVVSDIRAAAGRAEAVAADISNEAEVVRLFEQCDRALGRVTALVNNAGIVPLQGRLEATDSARIHRLLATNVVGSIICAREAVRRMSTRHGGRGGAIVNVSSAAAKLGSPNEYIEYAASKGAIESFTIGLAKEVADEGIRVNGVRPGPIDTDMHAAGGEPNRIARLAPTIPLKRGGRPEEVAEAILWLLSDAASYTTGSFIDVSGGR